MVKRKPRHERLPEKHPGLDPPLNESSDGKEWHRVPTRKKSSCQSVD